MRLYRAHGLGNDYLVLEDGPPLDAALARDLCDRHRGVGGDGVLEPVAATGADHAVRILNPDGSIAEKSGNGLRIYARWLRDRRGAGARFTVSTGFETVTCAVDDDAVTVAMGRARFSGAPGVLPAVQLLGFAFPIGDHDVVLHAVSVGNPHCVVFRDEADLDALPWREWGRTLETLPLYPNRTNVQIARVAGPAELEARIWERGAGETSASGSSACAVAAVAVRTGRVAPGPITVRMPGGVLHVRVSAELDLELRGPVEPIGVIDVDPAWLASRRR